MLAKKISFHGAILFAALATVLAGCTPGGPRALLEGKKHLDRGDFAGAVADLKIAVTLLATNAAAWDYYGVALQGAGQLDDAAAAYQNALKFDRDLAEAHFNLGNLLLEQNKPDAAKTELTAYALRRINDPAGWLELGSAQLKLGESLPAERSFSTVYHMDTNNAAALNGLGLARVQRSLPRDAAKFFAAAIAARPDYAAAILNLATVNDQYLHDDKAALENYRAYLALKPRPANYDEVSALVVSLESAEVKIAAATTTVEKPKPATPETKLPSKNSGNGEERMASSERTEPEKSTAPKPETTRSENAEKPVAVQTVPMQTEQVKPQSQIVATPPAPVVVTSAPPAASEAVEEPMPAEPPKRGFWHRLFGSSKNDSAGESKYLGAELTPLPADGQTAVQSATPTTETKAAPAPVFARYQYFSPRKPKAGDHTAASGAFTKARLFEQDEKWPDALQWYQQAAAFDPAWFEAEYNTGVLAHRLRNYALALPHYELALAIRPDSVDARYNFALALWAAGYAPDAAEQLKKIIAANPREARAHLALANICAQSLHDTAQARQHYQKVLELDSNNAQAQDIQRWLVSNPK
jgi:tetratricopeptide (TPR) repeat protein